MAMKPKYTAWLVVAIALTLSLIYAGYNSVLNTDSTSATVIKTNTNVKPFTAKDLDDKDYKFKQSSEIMIFEGFAEWCLPCRKSVPEVIKFSKKHPDVDVTGVAFRDVTFKTKEFQNKFGSFETTIKSTGNVEDALGLTGIPQTLFVVNSKVVYRVYGSANAQELERVLLLVKREFASSQKR